MALLRVLYCTQGSTIFWDDCTWNLMGQSGESGEKHPKRSRRLYDVANVLCACNLVAKVQNRRSRPTYKFLGGESVKSHFQQLAAGLAQPQLPTRT